MVTSLAWSTVSQSLFHVIRFTNTMYLTVTFYSRLQKTLEINFRGGVTDHNFWLVKMFKFKNAEILISGSIWSSSFFNVAVGECILKDSHIHFWKVLLVISTLLS